MCCCDVFVLYVLLGSLVVVSFLYDLTVCCFMCVALLVGRLSVMLDCWLVCRFLFYWIVYMSVACLVVLLTGWSDVLSIGRWIRLLI